MAWELGFELVAAGGGAADEFGFAEEVEDDLGAAFGDGLFESQGLRNFAHDSFAFGFAIMGHPG